jgi:hypothetical protein
MDHKQNRYTYFLMASGRIVPLVSMPSEIGACIDVTPMEDDTTGEVEIATNLQLMS